MRWSIGSQEVEMDLERVWITDVDYSSHSVPKAKLEVHQLPVSA